MMEDLLTVAWKEWKELMARDGRFRGGTINFLLVLVVFGIGMPWQFGRAWVESPMMLIYWAWVPLMLLSSVVVDSFAGERERHTLETLLASRLPDRAILFGKMLTSIAYAMAVTVGSLVLGLVTVNLLVPDEGWLWYPVATLAGSLATNILGATLIAGLGVLVSLRAASVRQASQLMGVAVLVVGFLPMVAVRALASWLRPSAGALSPADTALMGVAVVAFFLVIDVGLIAAAMARFQRSRLVVA